MKKSYVVLLFSVLLNSSFQASNAKKWKNQKELEKEQKRILYKNIPNCLDAKKRLEEYGIYDAGFIVGTTNSSLKIFMMEEENLALTFRVLEIIQRQRHAKLTVLE